MKPGFLFRTGTLAVISICLIFSSCKKKDTTEEAPTAPVVPTYGTPTAVGTPAGSSNTATIDSTGGTMTSADGRLEIIFPANALTAATTVTIQPVTNTAPGGSGIGYDLLPNGKQFNQPVTLKFHYDSTDVIGTSIHAFRIAYQKSDHIWYSFRNVVLDSAAGTESVTTTHFTPYSLYDQLFLRHGNNDIPVGTTTWLRVTNVKIDPNPSSNNTESDPMLTISDYATASQVSWTVMGTSGGNQNDGTVAPVSGSILTTYTAPSTTANMTGNPVSVGATVDVPGSSKIYLISNIQVLGPGNYSVQVDYTGTSITAFGYCNFDYSDHGSFHVFVDNNNVVTVSSVVNGQGTVGGVVNNFCTAAMAAQGNLLNIDSAYGTVLSGGYLQIFIASTMIWPMFNVDCGSGPFLDSMSNTTAGYGMPPVLMDNQVHVVTTSGFPYDLVTVRVAPN